VAIESVLAALKTLDLAYQVLDCDPAAADTAAFCARYGYAPDTVANTILVVAKGEPRRYAACVVRADRRLDVNHVVRPLFGASRASFASAEETERTTGMALGGVTPFGLPGGVPVFLDESLLSVDRLILGGGDRSSKIRIGGDLLRLIPGVRIVPGLTR
jgi:prolyl-tRNA editing enzyme YbaK/EbsC (Cys-tRNA(Pro) deacylase)